MAEGKFSDSELRYFLGHHGTSISIDHIDIDGRQRVHALGRGYLAIYEFGARFGRRRYQDRRIRRGDAVGRKHCNIRSRLRWNYYRWAYDELEHIERVLQ